MARIHQSGYEMNSMSANVEWQIVGGVGANTSSIAARSGAFGLRIFNKTGFFAGGTGHQFVSSVQPGPYFLRAYLKMRTLPGSSNFIMGFHSNASTVGNTPQCRITIETNRTLRLRNAGGTVIGSASAVLNADTWYMVELKTDASPASGSRIIEARLDGAVFATSSTQSQGNVLAYSVGGNLASEAETQGDWYWDDVALNDSTGSFQNSYPGSGSVVHLHPNATGDVNGFGTQTGGTAGAANNWTRVSDIAPNEATSFNGTAALNTEDLFNVDSPAWANISAADTINVVMVGARMRNNTSDAVAALKVEAEKTAAGTISQGTAIIPNTTSFVTNAAATPFNYPLIMYQDPDAAAWTRSTLETMQVGYKLTAAGTNRIEVTAVWASVDFTPVSTINTVPSGQPYLGVG